MYIWDKVNLENEKERERGTAIKMKNFLYFTVLFLIKVSLTSSASSEIDTNSVGIGASDRSLRKDRAVLFPSASTIGVSWKCYLLCSWFRFCLNSRITFLSLVLCRYLPPLQCHWMIGKMFSFHIILKRTITARLVHGNIFRGRWNV